MQMYIGIDWSEQKHDVMFLNEKGGEVSYKSIAHIQAGFEEIEKMREQIGIERSDCILGLETAHNLVLDYLWNTGYSQVYVIVPNIVNKSRGRYRQSGANYNPILSDILKQIKGR